MYAYSGLGDRVSQTNNGVTTNYSLDLNAGLTQVLSDGTNTYLYGLGRIGEQQASGFAYHLGDALGSVRQLVDVSGVVQLMRSYEPYGTSLASAGNGSSIYGFTGEQFDTSNLIFLRARFYDGNSGRFLSRDLWSGDSMRSMTMNGWGYVSGNPTNRIDPSGFCEDDDPLCAKSFTKAFNENCYLYWEDRSQKLQDDLQPSTNSPLRSVYGTECGTKGKNLNLPTTDGYVIGISGTFSAWIGSGLVSGVWDQTKCNNYGTGGFGFEIVYDFKHQQSAIFSYGMSGETVANFVSAGLSVYEGTLWGFNKDVSDYGGQSRSLSVSGAISLPFKGASAGLSGSIGLPYSDGVFNPSGIFGAYLSKQIGLGIGTPVNVSDMQSQYYMVGGTLVNYSMVDADGYGRNYKANRKVASVFMETSLQILKSFLISPLPTPSSLIAVDNLRRWVNYRYDKKS